MTSPNSRYHLNELTKSGHFRVGNSDAQGPRRVHQRARTTACINARAPRAAEANPDSGARFDMADFSDLSNIGWLLIGSIEPNHAIEVLTFESQAIIVENPAITTDIACYESHVTCSVKSIRMHQTN